MKTIFYQANFCAECGNPMKSRLSLAPRYFCDECQAQIGRWNYFKPIAAALLAAILAVFVLNRTLPPLPNGQPPNIQSNTVASTSAVTALDTVVTRKNEPNPELETRDFESIRVMCGARTKKGKPCRRLVQRGQRCAQHRGMASLLETRGTNPFRQ